MARLIFITGGVVSSLGKGLASAALGALLQARGYKVRLRKLDPYLNVDPGTMSPFQHGEVYVTDDGAETDLDLGHYERFTGVSSAQSDNVTAGRIYQTVISRERRGGYLGRTVQVIPHVTDAIKEFVMADTGDVDFLLCEIGGTVGDIEGLPFFEAIRQLGNELGRDRTCFVHLTLVPYIETAGELKTKPTQHSVRELRAIGIQPDVLLCRSHHAIPEDERRKIALFCNVRPECVIPALDLSTIYEAPSHYHHAGFDTQVLRVFGIDAPPPDLTRWDSIVSHLKNPEGEVRIAVIGKYIQVKDSYKSLSEALTHGGIANNVRVHMDWIDSEIFDRDDAAVYLENVHGILVPGGFGERGTEGKIRAVQFARERKVPFFGICYGLHMAVIEAARNLAGLEGAGTTENGSPRHPVIALMTEWAKGNQVETRDESGDMGGTMRLGAYPAALTPGSHVAEVYGTTEISERHRHRYEVNVGYTRQLAEHGLVVSGWSPDGRLPEIMEIADHPWFIGVQFHPELKSRPFAPHPLFTSFVAAAVQQSRLV
ncbi:MAG: CTP synthase [Alphaproteobacteria bacterium]|jgi:CTP synthase|nr:CTP synthase [Alphaproteobacteria bacterium]OJU55618.1 MAG: CTP synthase [Alphaproteobacteria bacterium 62-8]MBN9558869.1 CTP synthase [Alphaproteobacteria bacterium]MBN9566152.1 CTP synthase [Alphaproteobacteria bacterium]MBN9577908.1 CTP synthase [Alphaproteobacteria bacterium]